VSTSLKWRAENGSATTTSTRQLPPFSFSALESNILLTPYFSRLGFVRSFCDDDEDDQKTSSSLAAARPFSALLRTAQTTTHLPFLEHFFPASGSFLFGVGFLQLGSDPLRKTSGGRFDAGRGIDGPC
jgi:hypothetical protein